MVAPLIGLMNKKESFSWINEHQKAFDELKRLLMTIPVLYLFDPDLPYTVETDTSKYTLGVVLSQPGKDGRLHPIAFYSRKFVDAETRYATGD